MHARRLIALSLGTFAVSACALVADLGERTLGDPNAVSGTGGKDASKPKKDSSKNTGDDDDDDDSSSATPDFCDGIVLYASFDGKLTGDVGGDSTTSRGSVSTSPNGKFGGALSLVGNNAESGGGAAHFFLASNAGNPWPGKRGSLAVWFRATEEADGPEAPVLYRPIASAPDDLLRTAGLAFYLNHDDMRDLGFFEGSGGSMTRVLAFPVTEVAPYLKPSAYNHYFTTWDEDGPFAGFAINGGLGAVLGSGSAGDFPDGGAPYRASTTRSWTSEGEPVGLRLGGVATNAPQGTYDDLVVWDHVLSFEQAAAVFQAGESVGEHCGL